MAAHSLRRWTTAVLVAALSAPAAWAADEPAASAAAAAGGPEDGSAGPQADLARLEAEAQAFRMLYRRLVGLQVTAESRVEDLLARGPDLRASAWNAVRRRAKVARGQTYSDGAVAVQVHVPLALVVEELKAVCAADGRVERLKPEDLDAVRLYTNRRALWGFGQSRGQPRLALSDAPPVGWYDVGVFGRLQARRQATASAQRQLLAQVRALRFSAARRVGEFIDSDRRIADDLATFLRARPRVVQVRYLPQRLCEVDLTLETGALVTELKSLANAYPAGPEFAPAALDGLTLFAREPLLEVTGVAVPAEMVPPDEAGPEEVLTRAAEARRPEGVPDADQADLLATRAAVARCREALRADLLRLEASDGTTVADWVARVPALRQDLDRLLDLVRLVHTRDLGAGRVEVTAELPLARLRELLAWYRARWKAPSPSD